MKPRAQPVTPPRLGELAPAALHRIAGGIRTIPFPTCPPVPTVTETSNTPV